MGPDKGLSAYCFANTMPALFAVIADAFRNEPAQSAFQRYCQQALLD